MLAGRVPFLGWLGRLPGDLVLRRGPVTVYVPHHHVDHPQPDPDAHPQPLSPPLIDRDSTKLAPIRSIDAPRPRVLQWGRSRRLADRPRPGAPLGWDRRPALSARPAGAFVDGGQTAGSEEENGTSVRPFTARHAAFDDHPIAVQTLLSGRAGDLVADVPRESPRSARRRRRRPNLPARDFPIVGSHAGRCPRLHQHSAGPGIRAVGPGSGVVGALRTQRGVPDLDGGIDGRTSRSRTCRSTRPGGRGGDRRHRRGAGGGDPGRLRGFRRPAVEEPAVEEVEAPAAAGVALILEANAPDTAFAAAESALEQQADDSGNDIEETEYEGVTIQSVAAGRGWQHPRERRSPNSTTSSWPRRLRRTSSRSSTPPTRGTRWPTSSHTMRSGPNSIRISCCSVSSTASPRPMSRSSWAASDCRRPPSGRRTVTPRFGSMPTIKASASRRRRSPPKESRCRRRRPTSNPNWRRGHPATRSSSSTLPTSAGPESSTRSAPG